ncbi:MAG: LysM peptidoglycan-binding domain-containing protein [Bacteroidales bacterium]|nr:LysM peptidoglycan-binding domain-containing protein [Bacteroidales bacterium]
MKCKLLLIGILLGIAAVLPAQSVDPDSLEYLDEQEIEDLNSGKAIVDESTVIEMLDMVSNISYFRDVYLDIDTAKMNVYGYGKNEIPVFDDSVYMQRLEAMAKQTTIPFTYNTHVRSFIDLYANRLRQQSSKMLGLSYVYFPMFEEMLAKYNLPLELKYLAMVESALNPTAGSKAGAKGLWQFMLGTGKDYNLKVSTLVDERFDPMKETEAACRYLKNLYASYEDWFLVLAAYNCGPGNVNKAIMRARGVQNYWAIWPYLPKETRGYVPAFIAVAYVMNYATEHNIYPQNPGLLMHGTDTVTVHDYLTFDQLNEVLGVATEDVKFFNPQYTKNIIPASKSNTYSLRLPTKYTLLFVQLEDSIYNYKSKAEVREEIIVEKVKEVSESITHTVKKGESLGKIANRYHVSVANIKKWNNLRKDNINVGQKLVIYTSGSPMAQVGKSSEKGSNKSVNSGGSSKPKTHVVKRGETLSSIAKKNHCTVNELKKWNGIKGNNIQAGQKLKIKK